MEIHSLIVKLPSLEHLDYYQPVHWNIFDSSLNSEVKQSKVLLLLPHRSQPLCTDISVVSKQRIYHYYLELVWLGDRRDSIVSKLDRDIEATLSLSTRSK